MIIFERRFCFRKLTCVTGNTIIELEIEIPKLMMGSEWQERDEKNIAD